MASKYTEHSEMFIDLKKILEKSFGFLNHMQLQAVFEINGPVVALADVGNEKTTCCLFKHSKFIYTGQTVKRLSQQSYFLIGLGH